MHLKEIIPIEYIIIYLVLINLIGLLAMYIDKKKAKKSSYRIKEKKLFYIKILRGGIGSIAGMYLFRHKTKKLRFTIGIPVILILEIILITYILIKYYF